MSASGTILAISSAAGSGTLACLRLSGPGAIPVLASLSSRPDRLVGLPGFRGAWVDLRADGIEIPAWVQAWRAPRSYTREDLLEILLPGSPCLVGLLATALLASGEASRWGLRRAGPGEFTLRAFLNGRLDLSQAEAVLGLISATDEEEAAAARRGLRGELGELVRGLSARIVETVALLEAGLDFPDESLPALEPEATARAIRTLLSDADRISGRTAVRLASSGALRAVLAGFPNAGKSSLLNAILGRPAAITSEAPGSTRDPVRGTTRVSDRLVEWIDLAGVTSASALRPDPGLDARSARSLEELVLRLTRIEVECADRVLWVVDASDRPEASLREFRELSRPGKLLVFQKADLLSEAEVERLSSLPERPSLVSARTGAGVRDLVRRVESGTVGAGIERSGPPSSGTGPRFVVTAHQLAALRLARDALLRALEAVGRGLGDEWAVADLKDALGALDEILGRTPREAILDLVFSRFCIGK